ncbi:MAG: YwqI/YxiC family protein [Verrucomicrobia bacterium]|nr:YwqI/YxiC family protein [Verrucomicrobiota bacterium]
MSESDPSLAWSHIARRTQTKINVAWWLDRFTPMLVGLSIIMSGTILYLRSNTESLSTTVLLSTFTAALLLLGVAAWFASRRRFVHKRDTLARLDDQLHLNNALTTADHGIGDWPEAPSTETINSGLNWHWPRILTPFIVSTLVILAAFLIPVTIIQGTSLPPASQPLSWEQMENWLETLEETDLVEEQALDDVREKIEQLRAQPKEDWFSHSSMEASDSLRDALSKQIEQLGADLNDTERDLNAFQNFSSQMTESTKNQLLQEYQQAMKNLGLGQLPLDSKLMTALKNIDPSKLKDMSQLSKEQMDQLRKQLKKGAQACKKAGYGKGQGKGLGESDMISYLMKKNGQGPGRGGITRGPGEAPITLGDPNNLGTNNLESVHNPDFSRAAPGDLIGLGQTEHEVDKNKLAPQQAGAVKSTGQGGDTIWKESLLPAEKELLKRYFKTP